MTRLAPGLALLMFGWLALWQAQGAAQTRDVLPSELGLTVSVDEAAAEPFEREMVLITIRGVYRRHVTRESLVQPDLDGFSWAQLGPDSWSEEREGGRTVKVFKRRMALYPDRAGVLTIGPFTHRLTLTGEGDGWFEHEVTSAPITISVAPAPTDGGWWFPVRSLQISDQWSNPPDQLKAGEGVLRVVRLDALGVTPEMIPPMPVLTSPSAMIFAHPEKRLVELTPHGPVTHAFWRWTIRPTNNVSGIVEPMRLSYYDTTARVAREVTISPQRIAYGDAVPRGAPDGPEGDAPPEAGLPGFAALAAGLLAITAGLLGVGRPLAGRLEWTGPHALPFADPLRRSLKRSARSGDLHAVRRHAARLLKRDGADPRRSALLADLDGAVFGAGSAQVDLPAFARDFLRRWPA